MKVIKKDGTLENFNFEKIVNAITKSADRVLHKLTEQELYDIENKVNTLLENNTETEVKQLHKVVEVALEKVVPDVAKSYREYRNYKEDFVSILDEVYSKAQAIMYLGDKENSNTDSALVPTKRSLIYNELNKELYNKFFLTVEERQACRDGFIYVHDKNARRDTFNCDLFDVWTIMKDGFEMGNIWYNEPKTIDTACDVLSDIIMMGASSQYGGLTCPEVDKGLAPYVEKSYNMYLQEFKDIESELSQLFPLVGENSEKVAESYALKKTKRDLEQGVQGLEIKLNSVSSSRGDYPFISFTFGEDCTNRFSNMVSETLLRVRREGQGQKGKKKCVLFPKLIFNYVEDYHGNGKEYEWLFDEAIECSSKSMYPDMLSLTGEGYVASMYKKYKKIISPMGCVDGEEIITYKYKDDLFVESFKRMWGRFEKLFDVKEQDVKGNYYIELEDVLIYDSSNDKLVKCTRLIKNKDKGDWNLVKFSNGRSLLATSDHPLPVLKKGRTFISDIKIGDEVDIVQTQHVEEKYRLENDVAWVLGFILCDGCYDNHLWSSIALDSENDIEERYKKAMLDLFGHEIKTTIRARGEKGNYKDLIATGSGVADTCKYLETLFGGKQKIYRQIPTSIFESTMETRLSFLAGMLDADGYINNNQKTRPTVQLGSTNKELSLQTMALAQSLGYPTKVYMNHYNSSDKTKIRYRVEFLADKEFIGYITCNKKIEHFTNEANHISNETAKVTSVEFIGELGKYSYDVTTESDKFDVSGINSHNCRAFLSPYYEKGGFKPLDDTDVPVFVGRFNIGAISLHLMLIYQDAKVKGIDFYQHLDKYLEMIRNLHLRTYNYLGHMKASTNPLAYCEGGLYGGNLKPSDKIEPLLKSATASFGITGLNELQRLYNGKSLIEDSSFALEVLDYINKKVEQFKDEDGRLYAIYGTPAENLVGLQTQQFKAMFGEIKDVSDRTYISNSFHCNVREDISPIQKQDTEYQFWDLCNGGKIQYVKYPIGYNKDAIKSLVRRAMKMGLYEGVNLALSYCDDCGHQEENMDTCPVCGSDNLTKIDRMNGYLSYSRVKGDTRLNSAKMDEIADRVSM